MTIEKELLSVVKTLKEFWTILLGQCINVFIDHKNITCANSNTRILLAFTTWRIWAYDTLYPRQQKWSSWCPELTSVWWYIVAGALQVKCRWPVRLCLSVALPTPWSWTVQIPGTWCKIEYWCVFRADFSWGWKEPYTHLSQEPNCSTVYTTMQSVRMVPWQFVSSRTVLDRNNDQAAFSLADVVQWNAYVL